MLSADDEDEDHLPTTESSPLLNGRPSMYDALPSSQKNITSGTEVFQSVDEQWSVLKTKIELKKASTKKQSARLLGKVKNITWEDAGRYAMEPVRNIPAVVLGLLLNILDGVSYGMITFPTSMPIFANFGGDGVSMFFATCVISQLVYSLGGSIFKAGNGSMMIEVVPFYHILVKVIVKKVGDDNAVSIVATTMVAFALSSILTGLLFLLLGTLRLGILISYFPRHILIGCIGGVGVFLMETGFAVAARIEEEGGFKYDMKTLHTLTANWEVFFQWAIPLGLAILLNVISSRVHHPLLMPGYFLTIPVLFYVVTLLGCGLSMDTLWKRGWVFDIQESTNAPFYRFYTYFDFRQTNWAALWATMPTQMALVFFGILHVPLNVPALGVSVNEDNVDTDRELIAHGISNISAGFLGSVPNYLCYVNSVLFYRVGGGSRLSGLMLAGATSIVWIMGPSMIGYLPIMVVGALIFVLGLDLVREAIWDTLGRVNHIEYITILIIVVVMTLSDFVIGSLVGIILACLFFVMQTSRRNPVRTVLTGQSARSTVRRQMHQRKFLEEAGSQTQVLKLQGSLFFGTINSIEQLVRRMLDLATWKKNPIRFLVMDFSLVSSMDFSAAEAMTRIHRMLSNKGVHLVLCGLSLDGDVAMALQNVDLWGEVAPCVEVFAHLNEALEWTERLVAGKKLSRATLSDAGSLRVPGTRRSKPAIELDDSLVNSPRYEHLHQAAKRVSLQVDSTHNAPAKDKDSARTKHLLSLLSSTLGPYMDPEDQDNDKIMRVLVPELEERMLDKGTVLWECGDSPDALFFIESGILKAQYIFSQDDYVVHEAMLAGTIAGELTCLSQQTRDATVVADLESRVWQLKVESLTKIARNDTQVYRKLVQVLLRVTTDEQNCLMSYLVSRLS
ncbi:vacuole protein [Malassezia pachydermatis]|uniref:Vacuole protein n=1 Tax=Malassezia pachydermatis TaxID=77020 RepID=A0A0N0RSB2_9BASI|nr:vacuole protein [Malassezia pachydermatis]KOS14553.1 vacuole protein [Malassezia pachydermatis]